jgi:hypothetical protein
VSTGRELIVCGSASCVHEDYGRATALFPLAEVLLVNGACQVIAYADHILAGHTDKAEQFQKARKRAFPDAPPWRVHANWRHPGELPKAKYPSVTDWWGPEMSSGATSAGKAALIGLAMGFDRIILCGCPMDGSGYAAGELEGIKKESACQRIGDPKKQKQRTIIRYRERMAELAAGVFKGRVYSMSGFTKECLGGPQ